jgi:thiol-disulfide isomerase/thioredoxin
MLTLKYILVIATTVLVATGCTSDGETTVENLYQISATNSKSTLPNFTLTDMGGNIVNLQDFKGKVVFINLWASWCRPCREEMPSIQKLFDKTKEKNVQFVMLAMDDDFGKSLGYFNASKFTLPAFYPATALPELLNVQGIPATFIFNAKGELVKRIEGGDNYDTEEYLKLLSQ